MSTAARLAAMESTIGDGYDLTPHQAQALVAEVQTLRTLARPVMQDYAHLLDSDYNCYRDRWPPALEALAQYFDALDAAALPPPVPIQV